MGLTNQTAAHRVSGCNGLKSPSGDCLVALVGNPNTGKSTLFNALTKLKQHTGNWPGKTVQQARGYYRHNGSVITMVDLPGTYSLWPCSPEEEVTRDFLCFEKADVVVVVADATCLERNLNFALQVMEVAPRVVVCLNLIDEARRKKIHIDVDKLQEGLGVPVIPTAARSGENLKLLKEAIYRAAFDDGSSQGKTTAAEKKEEGLRYLKNEQAQEAFLSDLYARAEKLAAEAVKSPRGKEDLLRRLDHLLTSRLFGYPLMLALLGLIFWLTISGANYPSHLLAEFLFGLEDFLSAFCRTLGAPPWLHGLLVLGSYRSLAWVTAVMLPPMAIFFPLFTFLEDLGYLPRVAFNLDRIFKRAGAHGKQALTMSMGFGCNAAGVMAARIIDSPKERLIAILTNGFVPCNGKFPALIALSFFFVGAGSFSAKGEAAAAVTVVALVLAGIGVTLLVSRLLSVTLLKGEPSCFSLELPPYRMPQIGRIFVRSFLDRTIFVLGRAVTIAAPAGGVIWLMANIPLGGASLLSSAAGFLEPLGRAIGLDGVILLAFLLGFPANEIVIPLILMSYLGAGTMVEMESAAAITGLLISNGWTRLTALNTMLFFLLRFPCGTTLFTIYRETGSLKWMFLCIALTLAIASGACFLAAQGVRLASLIRPALF